MKVHFHYSFCLKLHDFTLFKPKMFWGRTPSHPVYQQHILHFYTAKHNHVRGVFLTRSYLWKLFSGKPRQWLNKIKTYWCKIKYNTEALPHSHPIFRLSKTFSEGWNTPPPPPRCKFLDPRLWSEFYWYINQYGKIIRNKCRWTFNFF